MDNIRKEMFLTEILCLARNFFFLKKTWKIMDERSCYKNTKHAIRFHPYHNHNLTLSKCISEYYNK